MDLTAAYEIGAYTPGAQQFAPQWAEAAAAFRGRLGAQAELAISYGTGARNTLDLFRPKGAVEGLVVFIHGGYWLRFDRTSWSHLAAGPFARGWAVALPSYTLAPEARISKITKEVATAVTVAADLVAGPIVVTGHSAGGHLAARMRCADVELPHSVATRLKRVVPISPLADLRPLLQTEMNSGLRLDAGEAMAESPMLAHDLRGAETVVWVGAEERPVFLDQARWLTEAWPGSKLRVAPGRHHFDLIDGLTQSESAMTRSLIG